MVTPSHDASSPEESVAGFLQAALALANQSKAERITSPHALAAETLGKVFSVDATALTENLHASAKAINGGLLDGVEGTLASQAATLNALFHRLTQFTFEEPRGISDFSGYLKLALRAQAQCSHTLEVLGNLKQGPRVIVAKQLNAAHQQVVNNGSAGDAAAGRKRTRLLKKSPPPILPHSTPTTYAALDTRIPDETESINLPMAAMEEIHRPQDSRRKGTEPPEC